MVKQLRAEWGAGLKGGGKVGMGGSKPSSAKPSDTISDEGFDSLLKRSVWAHGIPDIELGSKANKDAHPPKPSKIPRREQGMSDARTERRKERMEIQKDLPSIARKQSLLLQDIATSDAILEAPAVDPESQEDEKIQGALRDFHKQWIELTRSAILASKEEEEEESSKSEEEQSSEEEEEESSESDEEKPSKSSKSEEEKISPSASATTPKLSKEERKLARKRKWGEAKAEEKSR